MRLYTTDGRQMLSIPFVWEEDGSLVEQLSKPFHRLSLEIDVIQRPMAALLCHDAGTTTDIGSRMHDIGPRTEVGVLVFSRHLRQYERRLDLDVPKMFGAIVTIEKLVITEQEVLAESGIAFKNARREEIIIVAGAQPYGLAIAVPWGTPTLKFDPEYPLERYSRVLMT